LILKITLVRHPTSKMKVAGVVVEGNSRMRQQFFEKELSAFNVGSSESLEDLSSKVSAAIGSLQGTGLFDEVGGSIVVPPLHNKQGVEVGGDVNKVEVHLKVKEKGIPYLEMGTFVRSGGAGGGASAVQEEGFELDGAVRSPFGHGETGKISLASSRKGTRDVSINLSVPHVGAALRVLNVKGAITQEDKTYYQSFRLKSTVLLAELASRCGRHLWEGSFCYRDEVPRAFMPPSPSPSPSPSSSSGGGANETTSLSPSSDTLPPFHAAAKDASSGVLAALGASTKLALKYVFCSTIVLPSFLVRGVSLSLLSIYYCLPAFSDTTWHESNHHSHPSINQSIINPHKTPHY
jgi:hypothetical protein